MMVYLNIKFQLNCFFKLSWNISVKESFSPPTQVFSYEYSEAATGGVLSEKMFLEISQNSQENICARVSFSIKLQA